jgi:flagellar hook protein FlgE
MLTSFSTALSALNATSTAIDVVGNNLANLNTPGFKTSVVSFHDLVTQSLGAGLGETQVGFGVGSPITLRQFSQGGLQTTGGPLDAAIQGDGFFVVRGSTDQNLYTRGGNLQVDLDGNLTTATGEKLQGWTDLSGTGNLDTNATIGDIVVPVGTLKAPIVTNNVSVDLNLNAAGVVGAASGEFSASMEVFDSLGNSHMMKLDFSKTTTANQWTYSVSIPDADVSSPFTPVTGTLTFDSNGKLASPASTDPAPLIPITGLVDGAADMNVTWNIFNSGIPRMTQFSEKSATSANAQDGAAPSNLIRVGLANGGKIIAQYSNGQQTLVGQVAMALVRNPQSLIAVGNNNFALSARSALPAVGMPDTGGRGSVLGGSVEGSTVDIAKEFTNLIILQRGYQANAKVVTTVDEMSRDTINLKQ